MKRNRIALIVAILLGGTTFWLVTRRDKSTLARELRDFSYADTASITRIFLADKKPNQVELIKQADGTWKVNGKFQARPDAVKVLLSTIHDISVRQPVSVKARQNIIKSLITGAVKCEIYAGDKLVKQYYVGAETPDMFGTYMLLCDVSDPDDIINSTEPFEVEIKGFNGYLTPRYFTKESEWRDRTAFKYHVPDIRSVKVEFLREPQLSYVVKQTAGSKIFTLQDLSGKTLPFDTLALKQYLSYYGKIGFENFETSVKPEKRDSILRSSPTYRITVTDASNKAVSIPLYLKKNDGFMPEDTTAAAPPEFDPDRMYATVNEGRDFVTVQYYVFGKLLPSPDYFRSYRQGPGQKPEGKQP